MLFPRFHITLMVVVAGDGKCRKKFICLLIILNKIWQIKRHPKFPAWTVDNCDYMFHNVILPSFFLSCFYSLTLIVVRIIFLLLYSFDSLYDWAIGFNGSHTMSQANTENRKISVHIWEMKRVAKWVQSKLSDCTVCHINWNNKIFVLDRNTW